jgi:hypothetical protein
MKPAIRPSTIQEMMPMAKSPSKNSPVFKPEGRGASRAMLPARSPKGTAAAAFGASLSRQRQSRID